MTIQKIKQYIGQTVFVKYELFPQYKYILEIKDVDEESERAIASSYLEVRNKNDYCAFYNTEASLPYADDFSFIIRPLKPIEKAMYNTIKQFMIKRNNFRDTRVHHIKELKRIVKYLSIYLT